MCGHLCAGTKHLGGTGPRHSAERGAIPPSGSVWGRQPGPWGPNQAVRGARPHSLRCSPVLREGHPKPLALGLSLCPLPPSSLKQMY